MAERTTRVHVIGPNLRSPGEADFHVHAEGCKDVTRARMYAGPEFKIDRTHTWEMDNAIAVVEFCYDNIIDENDAQPEDYLSCIKVFPCVKGWT